MKHLTTTLIAMCVALGMMTMYSDAQDSRPAAKSIYDFTAKSWDGKDVKLSDYKGKAIVFVNVASRCGFTKQYAGLQSLYKKYKAQGLVVIAFPCNQFGAQEPGTNKEIQQFCTSTFNVEFPVMAKVDVNGKSQHPLFKFLTESKPAEGPTGKVRWNFEKFVVNHEGKFVGRYRSATGPMSKTMIATVEKALKK